MWRCKRQGFSETNDWRGSRERQVGRRGARDNGFGICRPRRWAGSACAKPPFPITHVKRRHIVFFHFLLFAHTRARTHATTFGGPVEGQTSQPQPLPRVSAPPARASREALQTSAHPIVKLLPVNTSRDDCGRSDNLAFPPSERRTSAPRPTFVVSKWRRRRRRLPKPSFRPSTWKG